MMNSAFYFSEEITPTDWRGAVTPVTSSFLTRIHHKPKEAFFTRGKVWRPPGPDPYSTQGNYKIRSNFIVRAGCSGPCLVMCWITSN